MSDSESHRSTTTAHFREMGGIESTDEALDDHRNQPASLPIKVSDPAAAAADAAAAPGSARHHPQHAAGPISYAGQHHNQMSSPPQQDLGHDRHQYLSMLRSEFNRRHDDDPLSDSSSGHHIPLVHGTGGSLAAAARRGRSKTRSQSFAEQVKSLQNPTQSQPNSQPQPQPQTGKTGRATRRGSSAVLPGDLGDQGDAMARSKTNDSGVSDSAGPRRERRPSRSSIDSEQDSHASRSSQETEEDVCFPMLREHVRIKGIDFDEIEEFIKAEREEEAYMKEQQNLIAERTSKPGASPNAHSSGSTGQAARSSAAALKYTPKNILKRTTTQLSKFGHADGRRRSSAAADRPTFNLPPSDTSSVEDYDDKRAGTQYKAVEDSSSSDNVKFGGTQIKDSAPASVSLPDRFSFFSSESDETIHAPDIPSLVEPGQTVRELFRNGESTWWLDCGCPTDAEMKMLAKAFAIHPLTAEDIRMQETREKVELFRSYYFVCFHTFEPDKESEDYLEPINVYIVVFREGILSFHFSPIQHPANVRRRVRQLRDYVDVSADWLCYALIDDITDEFAPVITGIEYEADAIEDSVFVAREMDFSVMLQRIGDSRRKVMTLMRLLSGKADVIKMFAKRCQDEAAVQATVPYQSHTNLAGFDSSSLNMPGRAQPQYQFSPSMGPQGAPAPPAPQPPLPQHFRAQPRADIALYLGDIQDHVVTMFQNLLAYEKIFSRSHANYLAQLQVESFHSNNAVTQMLSKVTMIGTIIVPLNVITGLFGMNVHVPGEGLPGLKWFFGIVGVMVFLVIASLIAAKYWLRRIDPPSAKAVSSSRRSIKSFALRRNTARSILSFPGKYE
ncbi:Magnesium transporter ALR1 [[Candida] zeylanoides]